MRRRRVVVVDDHAGFRSTLRRLLEADGWDVVGEAGDGATAIATVPAMGPDLVLVDVGLPDMDGFVVAERLVRDSMLTVVLISSRDAAAYEGRIAASPVRGFLAKADLGGDALRALLAGPAARDAAGVRPRRHRGPRRHRDRRADPGPARDLSTDAHGRAQLGAPSRGRRRRLVDDRGRPRHRRPAAGEPARAARDPHRVRLVRRRPGIGAIGRLSYLGVVVHGWFDPLFALVILAYPTGRIERRPERLLAIGFVVVQAAWTLAKAYALATDRLVAMPRLPGDRQTRGSTPRSRWTGSDASRRRR